MKINLSIMNNLFVKLWQIKIKINNNYQKKQKKIQQKNKKLIKKYLKKVLTLIQMGF